MHVKKSCSTQCRWKKKVEKRKRGNVKLNIPTHLEHSSDGRYYFGWWPFYLREGESQREGDEEGVHVPYYTVVIGENCNHLWLTWNTLHTERHFSLISRLFFSVLTATTISTEAAWDPASILRVKQEWRLCPLEGDDDESQTQTCFIKTESEKRWVIKCVCRENTGRDHNSITPIWSSVCASMWNTLGLNSITRNCYLKAVTLLKVQKSTIAKRHVFDVLLSKTNSKYILSRVLRVRSLRLIATQIVPSQKHTHPLLCSACCSRLAGTTMYETNTSICGWVHTHSYAHTYRKHTSA